MEFFTLSLRYPMTELSSASKTCPTRLQPYSGCITLSPRLVESRMLRLSSMSLTPLTMVTDAVLYSKTGGKAQPVPRKGYEVSGILFYFLRVTHLFVQWAGRPRRLRHVRS